MQIEAYLFCNGNCEEALALYERAFGAELQMLMRYSESPEPLPPGAVPAGWEDKVMHASLRVGDSTLMASDGRGEGETPFRGFSLSVAVADAGQAERLFATLSEGGQVQMPLGRTFWSPCFGMVADRYGVSWTVSAEH
jgi:PhnB protein